MTDAHEELRAALLMIVHKANEANIHRDEDDVLETIIEIARAALAAAPQPAPADRDALAEVIQQVADGYEFVSQRMLTAIADALLARGLRLPGGEETMAWAVVREDGYPIPDSITRDEAGCLAQAGRWGLNARPVAIRVVKGGDDAA